MPAVQEQSASRSIYFTAIVLAMLSLCGRAVFLTRPVNSDTALFAYMGKLVSQGGRMGVDLVDNKLPSVGLLMTVPYRLLGAAWWGYAAIGLVMSILASLLPARAAGRCIGPAARWPVLVASALWLNFTPAVFGQLQLETIEVFFTAIAACAALELLTAGDWRDAFLIGLATGMAMWAKPTAAAILPAVGLAIVAIPAWRWRKRTVTILVIAVGTAIPLLACGFALVQTGMAASLPGTIAQLRDYSSHSSADLIDLCKPLVVLGLLLLPVLMLGPVFRRDRLADSTPRRAIAVFVIAWLAMELLAVIAQRRMYAYHFLVLATPAALLCGLIPRKPRATSLLVAFGPALAMSLIFAVELGLSPRDEAQASQLAAFVRQHAEPSDAVWMDDYAQLLMESDRPAGSRVPLIFLFANSDQAPAHFSGMILDDFHARQPRWVVLPLDVDRVIDLYRHHMVEMVRYPARADAFAAAMHRIDQYVHQHYEPIATIGGTTVWERTDTYAQIVHE